MIRWRLCRSEYPLSGFKIEDRKGFLWDGTFLNAEIIKQGFGFAYTRFPFKYMDEFRRYEREAKEQNRGLWGKSN